MKGDFSRKTFKEVKNYNGVLKQQGRVSIDADANELMEILAHQRRVRTVDIIGTCCAPINAGGFKIRHPGHSLQDLLFSTGRIYVGGLLCELHPGKKIPVTFPASTTDKIQVEELKINGQAITTDQWVVISTREEPEGILAQINTINTTDNIITLSNDVSGLHSGTAPRLQRMILYSGQPDYPDAPGWTPVAGQTDLIYLDVWERHITAIEDPDLREVALGGPDTTTRIQTVSQVKILPNAGDEECGDEISSWNTEIAPSGGRLKTQTIAGTDPEDPCLIAEGGGYKGLENRLYRMEIHTGGDIGTATFKWSRDNGSIAYAIQEFIPDDTDPAKVFKVRLKQLGRDKILKIKDNDWLEISGDESDLDSENAGTIAQVTNVDEAQRILTLSVDVAAHQDENHAKVRRWDTGIDTPTPPTVSIAGPITLEDGIQILFSGNNFKVGDYWIFAARTATGEIEELDYEPPYGIKHYYCRLALVRWRQDGTAEIKDCRHEFPSLCELPKSESKGCCTVTVGEGGDFDDIQEAVDALNGGRGTVCILPGIYIISEPIRVNGFDITIKGCENASVILNRTSEVFYIQNSQRINITNLWCVSLGEKGRAIVSETSNFIHINNCVVIATGIYDLAGAITFLGNSLNTEIRDCIIAGMIGIRYQNLGKNDTAVHTSVRIEQNSVFALENAILQTVNASSMGLIVQDNLLLGFGLRTISKSFFPQSFFNFAEKKTLYNSDSLKKAKTIRKKGISFEKTTASNVTPLFQLTSHLKTEAATAKLNKGNMTASQFPTGDPVINLKQGALDANILNNYIIGKIGIFSELLLESTIERNWIMASQEGIALGSFEGVTIDDNFIYSGESGIQCIRQLATNFTISNNRFSSGTNGIEFLESGNRSRQPSVNVQISQLVMNAQISQNSISAKKCGIKLHNPEILVYDFTAFDNSISNCDEFGITLIGLDENQFLGKDIASYQRIVQRNSIQVKGAGIVMGVADAKILDNDITIRYDLAGQLNISYGIIVRSENCTVANNSVHGTVDPKNNMTSKGGIFINVPLSHTRDPRNKKVVVKTNRLSGGIGNGIEIGNNIDDLIIESNLIYNMGLNGIAVDSKVINTNSLLISNNKIRRCNKLVGTGGIWWKYAGIVLKSGEKIQILGNEICENGRDITNLDFHIGGIYAEQVREVIIANNQFVDNGILSPNILRSEAVIQIPAVPINYYGNEDVKITDNIVKGSRAPALFLGGEFFCYFRFCIGRDNKTVITGNHFESLIPGTTVELQSNYCVFSNNYVESPDSPNTDAVDLGYGWYVTALGNVSSAPISGGFFREIEHNIIY